MGDKKISFFSIIFLIGIFFVSGVIAQAGGGGGPISGETASLFTASQKIYLNEPLNSVKTIITATELPYVLGKGKFSGNVDAEYVQNLEIGSYPSVVYAKQPTSQDDPQFGLRLSTSSKNYLYRTSITFSRAVDFTHSDSKWEISLFGKDYIVLPETDAEDLVLMEGLRLFLDNTNPRVEVSIGGKNYVVELIAASDTAAKIKVGDETGKSETKEVSEKGSSKLINGLIVFILNADETNLKISASLGVGINKISFGNGLAVKSGVGEDIIEGTQVSIGGGIKAATKINIDVYAPDSDHDAVLHGKNFVDPVFGTFKIDFSSLNIPEGSSNREDIIITNNGDNKMMLRMKEHRGNEKEFQWAISKSTDIIELESDMDGKKIHVVENEGILRNGMVVLGNEDEGYLVKVTTITNKSGTSDDKVEFTDVFTGDVYKSSVTAEGIATIVVGGKSYTVRYSGTSSDDSNWVRINYPESQGLGSAVIYPTIESSKGAKVSLYRNKTLSLRNWDGSGNKLTTLKLPDGDGYTDVLFSDKGNGVWNIANGAISKDLNINGNDFVSVRIGGFIYRIKSAGAFNDVLISLENPKTGAEINSPALIIFEEKDNKGDYNGLIITLEPGKSSDDGIGVDEVIRTWSNDAEWNEIVLASDSKKTKEADVYGTIATIDASDADQKKTWISYPNEQVYANIYVASIISPEKPVPVPDKKCLRGDANNDGKVDLSDVIFILNYLFKEGPAPTAC